MTAMHSRPHTYHRRADPEAQLRDAIVARLNLEPGVWVRVNHVGDRSSKRGAVQRGLGKGTADIVGHVSVVVDGHAGAVIVPKRIARAFYLEVKAPLETGARKRRAEQEHQDEWARERRQREGAFVARIQPQRVGQEGIDMALAAVRRCREGMYE